MKKQIFKIKKTTKKKFTKAKYPFAKLKVGQSFFVPNKKQNQISPLCAFYNKQIPNSCFITQKETNNGIIGVRVYRIDENSTFNIN